MRETRLVLAVILLAPAAASAEVPYPTCQAAGCSDPSDFASYLFRRSGQVPDDFDPSSSGNWKYKPFVGMNVFSAWRISTGRPDVVVAVLDSGIRWNEPISRARSRSIPGSFPFLRAALPMTATATASSTSRTTGAVPTGTATAFWTRRIY